MNELNNLIFADVKEALFDICIKYENMLNVTITEGVDGSVEAVAAEAIFEIMSTARFNKMDSLLASDISYKEIMENLPSLEGMTIGEFVKLCYRSDRNYRIVEETKGGNRRIIFEMIGFYRSTAYISPEVLGAVLQKVEAEEDFFTLTYYNG